jgi:parallel beta-helix repeat protein
VGEGGLIDSTVRRHVAIGNTGDGIWFDWMNTNNQVYENLVAYNTGMGIHYEASQGGFIYNNYVFSNGQRGIFLAHSSTTVVAFNVIVQTGYEGLVVVDEGRDPTNIVLRPVGNTVHGNIVVRTGRSTLVMPLELVDNRSDFNLFLGLTQPTFALGWPSTTSPIRNGLVTWQTVSGLDLNSSYQAVDVPASLLAAFEQEVIYPDWTELLNIAAQYSAPSVTGVPLTHGKPGPSLQLSAAVVVVVEPTPTPTPEPTPTPTKPGKGGGRGKVK